MQWSAGVLQMRCQLDQRISSKGAFHLIFIMIISMLVWGAVYPGFLVVRLLVVVCKVYAEMLVTMPTFPAESYYAHSESDCQ